MLQIIADPTTKDYPAKNVNSVGVETLLIKFRLIFGLFLSF